MGVDTQPAVQLLYLLTFALSAIGIVLPLFQRSGRLNDRSRCSGTFLMLAAVTAILPSLQVLLGAMGLTEGLPWFWPTILNALFNLAILAGIWALSLTWSSLTRAFVRRRFFTDSIRRSAAWVLTALTGLNLALQFAAVVSRVEALLLGARIALLLFFTAVALVFVDGIVRILRPSSSPELRLLRIMPGIAVLGGSAMAFGPPALSDGIAIVTVITVLTLALILYLRQTRRSDDPDQARELLFQESGMTPREREIANMLAEGLSYKEISAQLYVSLSTIQTHVTRIYSKMEVNSKTELSRKLLGK